MNYPKPANWQDFQIFIKDLFSELYGVRFDIYGSVGQKQKGVDVYGTNKKEIIGIQCKRIDTKLTEREMQNEIDDADLFQSRIDKYIIATTYNRDVKMQSYITNKNIERRKNNQFEIEIWFWDSIEEEITNNQKIWKQYYKHIFSKIPLQNKDIFIIEAIITAFSRPAFYTPFQCENSGNDFLCAIKDTQEFLNTGRLNNRGGRYILESISYKSLSNKQDVLDIDLACEKLQEIRDFVTKKLQSGEIRDCGNSCFCITNYHVSDELNRLRKDLLLNVNNVIKRNNMTQIAIRF
jgi:hypothetical protein